MISSVLLSVIPFISLLVLNFIIFHTIKKKTLLLPHSSQRERRDLYVATILIVIVMVFAGCHCIKTAINLVELVHVLQGNHSHSAKLYLVPTFQASKHPGVTTWTFSSLSRIFSSQATAQATLLSIALRCVGSLKSRPAYKLGQTDILLEL